MKPIHYTLSVLLLASASLWAENNEGYKFETVVNQKVTPVKDQALPVHAGALPQLLL